MLARTLGPGKAQVQVNADLNVDKTTAKELTYAKKGVPLKTDRRRPRSSRAAARPRGGTAGTGANIPTYSAGAGGRRRQLELPAQERARPTSASTRRSPTTEVAPGAVNKLNVALMVDKSVPPAVVDSLKQTVATAAGVDTARGDTITADPDRVRQGRRRRRPARCRRRCSARSSGSASASRALLFLFFMTRGLRKREGEALGTPAWLTEIEEPVSLAAARGRTAAPTSTAPRRRCCPPRVPDASLHQLDQLMEREPERVAAQVRQWMAED